MFIDNLKEVPFYSLSFDVNDLKRQMYLHVSYWEDPKNHVVARYLDGSFMGKNHLPMMLVYSNFKSCTETLEDKKYLQVSLDGPNVNLPFFDILDEGTIIFIIF